MKKYKYRADERGEWVHRDGDIVGIDNRVWSSQGTEHVVTRPYGAPKRFPNKTQAKKWAAAKNREARA